MNYWLHRIFVLIGLILIITYSCTEDSEEDSVEPDSRDQFVGDYHFKVLEIFYHYYTVDTTYRVYDTTYHEFYGNIEKYWGNRLLIKYSSSEPVGRCVSLDGNSWCQGYNDSDCVLNCSESQLYYVKNWITPILMENDSLILFEEYSRRNGEGLFVNEDSIKFEISQHETSFGNEEFIYGIKIK